MKKNIYLILFSCLFITSLWANNYGKISGIITDAATGEPIIGANVYIEETSLGAATDSEGNYVILRVKPGNYIVNVSFVGYNNQVIRDVHVRSNRIATISVALKSTIVEGETITVVAERPLVEKDIAATSRSLSSDDMDLIPATSVNEILTTQPGVVNTGGLHFRGGRSGEVAYYVDGVPMINPLFGEINSTEVLNKDNISEMQVISGTYSAEYGNAMSGIINISTKEGGDRYNFDFDIKSSAAGIEDASVDNNRTVTRANFSGPIPGMNRANFIISGNYDDRDSYLPWGFSTSYNLFGKLSTYLSDNFKVSLGANLSERDRKSYSHAYRFIPDQYWIEPNTNSRMVNFGVTHSLSDEMFYTASLYYNSYHYDSGDYDYNDLSPAYSLDNNREFYTASFVGSYDETEQYTIGLRGDLLWQLDNVHEIKSGFEFRQHNLERFFISSPYYDDHTLDDYNADPYEFSVYAQDKINFYNILISAGLRFDLTAPNTDFWENPFHAFNNLTDRFQKAEIHTQLSPRLAISYPISERTVFHFGYGHYFQRPEYQYIYKTLSDNDYSQNVIMNLRSGNGRFGNPNLKPEKTITYEFGVSHQLFDDFVVNLSAYSKKIEDLTAARTFFAGDSSIDGINYWETFSLHINEDFGYNNGIEFQFRKQRGKNWFGEFSYTYAVAEGSSSGPLERVGSEEANRQSLKFFPLDFDQRHTINAYLTYRLNDSEGFSFGNIYPFENLTSSLLFQFGSGLPYTKGTRSPVEPYEINNKRLPENWTIDLKVNRRFNFADFKLTAYMEIYNLTDRENILYVDPFTGKPDVIEGRTREWAANPLNFGTPRLIYFGFQFDY